MEPKTRRILLAIGGGIAAYKAADLCSKLAQAGHQVQVVTSRAATEFIGDATLAALSGRPVVHDVFDPRFPLGSHIELMREIDAMVVAPATANLMAQFAHGMASDLISTLYLQNTRPVLLAPAMSDPMWNHAAVKRNVQSLQEDGCHFVGPDDGWLSCRVKGTGRMSEPVTILQTLETLFRGDSSDAK
ncbi:phosphopantothenoylcysteine decarboxylase [Rhodopirellula bahusiensis]|uniref:Phosphopantothenoylcysteine decarboxylase n=1 Tax=Rhodopirellula bahusiensis TaxID=2014065 RepID=A0A2G1WBB7_9BACT|nr:phosphopantothenoylcysteine decarboxylase [Rhodopirellula bahusiensis]PHQ35929.1 phosphopantothenoylcysteine decarboxylase [Rhodopirellula bahusiensis]